MSQPPRILLIDDDPDFQALARFLIERHGYQVETIDGTDGIAGAAPPALVLLDWRLGDLDGTELIQGLRTRFRSAPVVLVTAHGAPEVAVAAIKAGAFDFLTKPLEEGRLIATLAKAVEHHVLLERLEGLAVDQSGFEGMVGVSPQMQTVYSVIRNIAPTDVSIMIAGESGTGKELVANAIHRLSTRSAGPFVAQNMATLPQELVEATLFGHERGAFTGADRKRPGLVAEAEQGTLFLDEITEMPIDLQAKLLRFLQEKLFRPVGGSGDVKSNVRIISATNRDPLEAVAQGRFRSDLYYRLNVVPIELPPLREREGDVPLLAMSAVQDFSEEYGKTFTEIDDAAMRVLSEFDWPGNVRQLLHVMQRVVLLNEGPVVRAHMLPADLAGVSDSLAASTVVPGSDISGDEDVTASSIDEIMPLVEVERKAIERALELCDQSPYEAARRLGISTATIYRKIKLYQLNRG